MKFRDLLLLLEDDGDDDPPQVPGDTEGIEPGETGMPRGQGYPNAKYDIDKVIYLGYINGVTREQIRQYDEKYARQLKDFIKTKTPWLVPYEGYSYDYLSTVSDINNFVVNAGNRFRYWLDSDLSLDVFRDNPELDKERKQKILDIVEMYPDAVAQLDKLQEYLSYVEKDNPENPETQSNYPLFVSLYDRTRSLGGHEEGGWWYDVDKLVESKKVNDFKQAENAARYLYNKLDNMDLDGQPAILLEKISGGEDTTKNPAPVYESKYAKAAKQVIDNAFPPKEPVKHIIVKMELDGLFPDVSRETISVIPSTARLVINGVYIDTAPSNIKPNWEREPGDERGLDENGYYTLYVTKPEYIKVFLNYAFAVDGYGDFNYPEAQELLDNIYDALKIDGDSHPDLPL